MALLGTNPLILAAANVKVVAVSLANIDSVLRLGGASGLPFNNAAAQLIGTTVAGGVTPTTNLPILNVANLFTGTQTAVKAFGSGFLALSNNAVGYTSVGVGRTVQEGVLFVAGVVNSAFQGVAVGDIAVVAQVAAASLHLGVQGAPGGLPSLKLTGVDTLAQGDFKLTAAGKGVHIKSGANATVGAFTLNGTTGVVVNNTKVTANSLILLTIQSPTGTPGSPYISTRSAGASFTAKSSAGDTSVCGYQIVEMTP